VSGKYDDIINLPHHVSATRPRMSRENRAAQFSPFAALTGYDAAISETARVTDEKIELGDGEIADLEMKLAILADTLDSRPEVTVTHFRPDDRKQGGAYVTTAGAVRKIDEYERAIVFVSGERIGISDIIDIQSDIFED
jgi:hypothetical protein